MVSSFNAILNIFSRIGMLDWLMFIPSLKVDKKEKRFQIYF